MKLDLDLRRVVSDMVRASSAELARGGKEASALAAHEYEQFIRDVVHVQTMAEDGQISPAMAQALINQHKLSMQAVFLAVEGLGVIAVQNAINAAIAVLTEALGAAVKGLKFGL